MLLIDPPNGHALSTTRDVQDLQLPATSFAALYYPWAEAVLPDGLTRALPPSALLAGIWARIDSSRGVWKSPAGLHAAVRGAAGLQQQVPRLVQNTLNSLDINCIRDFPGRGIFVWGARTLAGRNDPQWRYLPTRRTITYIQQSIARSAQWTVFESNDAQLWEKLRNVTEAFLNELFRAGALQGASARDAYYVRCGLGETMTATDVQEGRVNLELGVALLRPTEFIVLRLPLAAVS